MSQVINTNIASLGAQNNLSKSQNTLQTALQRLSSGMRINSAKDDAAGMAIADRMTSQINGLNQAMRNANDGISMAQTADGALGEVTNILQRMRQLAVQSANASNSDTDRQSLNSEVSQLKAELTRIASTTQFNGQNILDGTQQNIGFQIGAQANQTIGVSIGDARATSVGTNVAYSDNATNGIVKPTGYNRYATGGTTTGLAVEDVGVGANGYTAQTITITDASGATIEGGSLTLHNNDQASDIAARLNSLQGVHATGYNAMTLSGWVSGANTTEDITFTVQSGTAKETLTLSGVTSTSSQGAAFAALEAAINGSSTLTNAGVTAGLNGNGNLTLRNNTGADLYIDVYTATGAGDATFDVVGTDAAATAIAGSLDAGAAAAATAASMAVVGGQLNISLANGYNIHSSVGAATSIFNTSANTNVVAAETGIGLSDVLSGADTAAVRVNSTGVEMGKVTAGAANGLVNAQVLTVKDASGATVGAAINVAASATAQEIASSLNALAGVQATASAKATISTWVPEAAGVASMSISVNGTSLTLDGVVSGSTADQIFAAAATAINQNSTLTNAGFSASRDGSGNLVVTNNTGDDINISQTNGGVGATSWTVMGSDAAGTTLVRATTAVATVAGTLSIAMAEGYTIQSDETAATSVFKAAANAAATETVNAVNYGNSVAAQTLTISGINGTASVDVARDSAADVIAQQVNANTATTGVTAEARTMAKLSDISAAGTVSFSLYGSNTTAVSVSAAVTGNGATANMTALASAINANSGQTGITASLTDNNASIVLTQADGKNIAITDFKSSAGSEPTSANINGSAVSLSVAGIANSVDSTGRQTSSTTSAVKLNYGGVSNAGADSTVVGGTVSFEGAAGFSVTSSVSAGNSALVGGNSSLFGSNAGVANNSAFSTVTGLDVSTVSGANAAISVVDAALDQINSIRGAIGAVQNRFDSTINSLTAAAQNISSARSRIQDTDFAAETANLTRSQILQ